MKFSERLLPALITACLLALCAGKLHAMGLGNASTRAVMGDTLRLSVPVRIEPGEQVTDECIAADVYFGDDKVNPGAVSAVMLPSPSAPPQATPSVSRTLLVRTTALINEPVVTVYLSAGCQARITRKFIALADPPSGAATQEQTEDVTAAPPVIASEVPLASKGVPRAITRAARNTHAPPSMLVAAGQGASVGSPLSERRHHAKAQRAGPEPTARAPVVQTPGSRLQLDPVEADALVSPDLRSSISMNADLADHAQSGTPEVQARREAAAALWRAMNTSPEQQLRDQQRLQELENRLGQLHAEGEQTRQSISLLHARMRQMESERPSASWMYVLGAVAVCALCLALYLYLLLRRNERQQAQWWAAQAEPPTDSVEVDAQTPLSGEVHARHAEAGATAHGEHDHPEAHHQMQALEVPSQREAAAHTVASLNPIFDAAEHLRDMRAVSVEELIDLEQQAEFFVVLGQDEAAISLLEGHVQGSEGAIPLPYLKLLEIYHRLDRRADYERVQTTFNSHFNGHAPTWGADLQHGRNLADYPGVVDRLQALWSMPTRAMEVLEKSLIRPDADAETFDLPAYRELLFLYAIARDLADKQHASDVNSTSPMPLTATRPNVAEPDVRLPLEVDLHLDEAPMASSNVVVTEGLPGAPDAKAKLAATYQPEDGQRS